MSNKVFASIKGFTLVEVLIAVGVMSVASFAFLPSFTGSLNDKKLQQAVDAVRDATATVGNRALTEVGNPGASDATKYKYAGVKFTRNSGEYISFRSESATSTVCNNLGSNVVIDSTKTLPNAVIARINENDSPLCVFFAFKTAEAVTTKGLSNAVSCSN